MNPMDLFNQVKEMIEKKDFEAAKKFVDDNKDDLGEYFDQAKSLVSGNEMVSGALDKIKGLFKTKSPQSIGLRGLFMFRVSI